MSFKPEDVCILVFIEFYSWTNLELLKKTVLQFFRHCQSYLIYFTLTYCICSHIPLAHSVSSEKKMIML